MQLSDKFKQALNLAVDLHATQKRKASDVPYITHLLAVTSLVLEYGASEEQAIAALLHDAIEDQGGAETYRLIESRFGKTIADMANACSDTDTFPKPPWLQRKENHLHHLRTAPSEVMLIIAADKLHNARSLLMDYRRIGEATWGRFNGGREGTLWYYREMIALLQQRIPGELTDELVRAIDELKRLMSATQVD